MTFYYTLAIKMIFGTESVACFIALREYTFDWQRRLVITVFYSHLYKSVSIIAAKYARSDVLNGFSRIK